MLFLIFCNNLILFTVWNRAYSVIPYLNKPLFLEKACVKCVDVGNWATQDNSFLHNYRHPTTTLWRVCRLSDRVDFSAGSTGNNNFLQANWMAFSKCWMGLYMASHTISKRWKKSPLLQKKYNEPTQRSKANSRE